MAPLFKKKMLGRQKIEMKLIKDKNARGITFSKRRVGVFRKATELTSLCGAQITLIVFSICGRAYKFENRCNDSILGRLHNGNLVPVEEDPMHRTLVQGENLQQLKEECDRVSGEIERMKKREKEVREILERSVVKVLDEDLSKLSLDELKEVKEKMRRLKEMMCTRRPQHQLESVDGVNLRKVEMDENDESHWLKL